MDLKEGYLCEVSWEVCNKVGGINTVIVSKAPYIKGRVPNYLLIGPYFPTNPSRDFIEEIVPSHFKEAFLEMKAQGIPCRYGRWFIKSEPNVILIDFAHLFEKKNEIKKSLWDWYSIDSLQAGFDFDEPVVFSIAAAKLIDLIQRKTNRKVVAQFHEWMTGAGLLWLKKFNNNVSSIFTTHATVLGRATVGNDPLFYSQLEKIDGEKEAHEHGVVAKHHMEKASAQQADVFSTVSEITALEAEYMLGRKADQILPNGIDLENFATFEELSIRHSELKHQIKDFIISFFFPFYSFDLNETLIFFIMGRYEFENKGIDVMIESLGKLNDYMKKTNSPRTIVSFFYIPAASFGVDNDILENKTLFFDIKNYISKEKEHIIDRVINTAVSREKIKKQNCFDEEFIENVGKKVRHFMKKGSPTLSTHDLKYPDNDAIIQGFKNAGLNNDEGDKVKVIFYPTYLQSADSLLNLDMYDAVLGGHLGIFPSAYEPWGYTPLESAALGVASITSDVSGFGRYIEKEQKKDNPGIFVLKRFGKNKDEIVKNLFENMKYYTSLDKEGRIQNKIEARHLATLADWKKLIENYFAAYNKAAKKFG